MGPRRYIPDGMINDLQTTARNLRTFIFSKKDSRYGKERIQGLEYCDHKLYVHMQSEDSRSGVGVKPNAESDKAAVIGALEYLHAGRVCGSRFFG